MKLLLIEIIAAMGVIVFLSVALTDFIAQLGFQLPIFNIPIYVFLVTLKTAVTVYVVLHWLSEYYEISPKQIVYRRGVIFTHEEKYPLKKLDVIEVQQTLLGKILNFGTVYLHDPFKTEEIHLYQIHNPMKYAAILEDLIENETEIVREVRRHIVEPIAADVTVK